MITVGISYEIVEGKNEPFESRFALVVEAMSSMPGHVSTRLFQGLDRRSYLLVSEWRSRAGFDAFVASDAYRNVANWGRSGILAARPRYEVYDAEARPISGILRDFGASVGAGGAEGRSRIP